MLGVLTLGTWLEQTGLDPDILFKALLAQGASRFAPHD